MNRDSRAQDTPTLYKKIMAGDYSLPSFLSAEAVGFSGHAEERAVEAPECLCCEATNRLMEEYCNKASVRAPSGPARG